MPAVSNQTYLAVSGDATYAVAFDADGGPDDADSEYSTPYASKEGVVGVGAALDDGYALPDAVPTGKYYEVGPGPAPSGTYAAPDGLPISEGGKYYDADGVPAAGSVYSDAAVFPGGANGSEATYGDVGAYVQVGDDFEA